MSESFSWLGLLASARAASSPVDAVGVIRAALREHALKGFELELVGRFLAGVAPADVPSDYPVHRVVVVASHTAEPVANAARTALLRDGVFADVHEAPFGSYRQSILSPQSEVYRLRPDALIVATAASDSAHRPSGPVSDRDVDEALDRDVEEWRGLWDAIGSRLNTVVLQHLPEVPDDGLAGVAERRAAWTPWRYAQALNARLLDAAPGFVRWVDVDALAARVGRRNWHDARLLHHGKIPFSPRFLPEYAVALGSAWRGATGRAKKALILDLDNTLWGGVLGDDGIDGLQLGPDSAEGEAFLAFCRYVRDLGRRGVILGICSKNELSNVTEMFERHSHMPLSLGDFAAVACNWDDKASNLAALARDLNIDPSAIVFVDDNPAECALIRSAFPEVETVYLAGDPSQFVRLLDERQLFDAAAFSTEDLARSASYLGRAQSTAARASAVDLASHLTSLEMTAVIAPAEIADLPRLAQMELKTNQFNLSTRRLTAEQLQRMSVAPHGLVLTVRLADRFADHGTVAYAACEVSGETFVVTDWVMSCRVFSRTLEHHVFNRIADEAAARGLSAIEMRFRRTPKNGVMEAFFAELGCEPATPDGGPWRYSLRDGHAPLRSFIAGAVHTR